MGDPYASLAEPVSGQDPYAGIAEPVAPHELPHEQRNQMLQDKILSGATFDEARNYAINELRLRPDERQLRLATKRHDARVRSAAPPSPPAPPPPDTSFVHDLAVAGRAIPYGLADAGAFALNVIGGPMKRLADLAGLPKPEDQVYNALDATTFGKPETSGQHYVFSGVRGATAALPTMGAGGVLPALIPLSGATSGLSGEAARQAGYGPVGQTVAAFAGGLAGGAPALLRRAPVVPGTAPAIASPGQRVYEAADRLGMANDLLPADVGGTGTRMATAASAMTLGGVPIARQSAKGVNALAGARDSTAEAAGLVSDATGAGQAAQAGSRSFIASSEARGGKLYDAIPIAPSRPAALSTTRQALADLNAGLPSNPKLSSLIADPKLKAFEEAFNSGGLSWQDLKAFRTYVGERAGSPSLQSDTSQKALKALYGALSEDMRATAASEGPQALTAFNRANQYWRGREDRIGNVLSTVLGNDFNKGEMAAFENINRLGRTIGGDPIKLGRLMRSLPSDEANIVRATIIKKLGQAKAGGQNAEGEVFSPAEFATQWNKLDQRAKTVLFNNVDVRRSLDDIATVASGMKLGAKYANTSKTALALNGAALFYKSIHDPVMAAGVAGGSYVLGEVLASPVLARALARVSRARSPAATRAALTAFSASASRSGNGGAQQTAATLQQTWRAMNDNVSLGRAAAASDDPGQNQQQ